MFGILAFLMIVSFASASSISTISNGAVSELSDSYSFNFTLSSTSAVSLSATSNASNASTVSVSFTPSSFNFNNTYNSSTVVGTVSGLQFRGKQNILVTISTNDSASSSFIISVSSASLCKDGIVNTDIADLELTDESSNVEDEWDWKPYDSISLEGRFRNDGNEDNEDYVARVYFFLNGQDVSDEVADDEDLLEQDINNLDSGKKSSVIPFDFKVSGDAEDSSDYKVYLKVYKDGKESQQCAVEEIEDSASITKQGRQVIVRNVEGPLTVSCGETISLSALTTNVGEEDEDQVKVIVYNKDLGLTSTFKEITQGLDSGDSDNVAFSFVVPVNAQEKAYKLIFSTEYDYDEDDENYDEESDSEDDYQYTLNVLGNCVDLNKPTITAKLTSDAQVGKEMTIEVSVKNNGDSQISALLSVGNYDSWAKLESINSSTLSIAKADTKTSILTFVPSKAGQQTLGLTVVYNGKTVTQPVSITISEEKGLFSSVFGNGQAGLPTYLIMGIIALVVLIIIVLVLKAILSRKE